LLTRLVVRGFKNLFDIDIRFGPFTCIVGPNGVGKSNLFDAITFLSLLTKHPIMEAARLLRETKGRASNPGALFSTFGTGSAAEEMRFIAELIVDRNVTDEFGVQSDASISTLRYEIAFKLDTSNGVDRLELTHESLKPIRLADARKSIAPWAGKDFIQSCITGRRAGTPFISTEAESATIQVHQEGHGGRRVPAPKSSRTALGGMASSDFPTVLAAHREMESWRTLLLEPSAMRAPSFYQDERTISPQGGNLSGAIFRLQQQESSRGAVCAELATFLSRLVDGIQEVRVSDDSKTESLTLEVRGADSVFHPAKSLSDGTLRFLVLATMSCDPSVRGLLCLEEPENGIHPPRIGAIVQLLRDIAVDAKEEVGPDNPLRQVIVNTHSPDVFGCCDPRGEIVYFDEAEIVQGSATGRIARVRVPEGSWRKLLDRQASPIPKGRIRAFLGESRRSQNHQYWLAFP
jgi:predicted ATPase